MITSDSKMLPRHCRNFEIVAAGVMLIISLLFIARQAIPILGESYFVLADDAMISMTYARNLAEGFGLTWFPGTPPVEGFTNPLWTLLMAAVHLLPVHESKSSLVVMLAGIPILFALMYLVGKICDELSPEDIAARSISVALAGTYYGMAYWALRGMEVALMSALVLWGYLLVLRLAREATGRRIALLLVGLALLLFLRMDGVVPGIVLAMGAGWMLRGRARLIVPGAMIVTMLVTLGALTLARHEYYGEWLPNTYYLKLTGAPVLERWGRGVSTLSEIVWVHLWLVGALAGFEVWSLRRAWRTQRGSLVAVALIAAQCAYSAHVGGDAWEGLQIANRYLCISVPLLTMLTARGLLRAVREFRDQPERREHLLRLLLIAVAFEAAFSAGRLIIVKDVTEELSPGQISAWRYIVSGVVALVATGLILASRRFAGLLALSLSRHDAGAHCTRHFPAQGASMRGLVVLTIAIWIPLNGNAVQRWIYDGAALESAEPDMLRLGLYLRATTPPTATAAVTWAGTVPYFSRLRCYDFLGKCDPVVARMQQARDFYPGHNKWSFRHTVGELRPSLIVQTPHNTKADIDYMLSLNYRWMQNTIFVRLDDPTLKPVRVSRDWTQQDELEETLMIAGGKKFLGFM